MILEPGMRAAVTHEGDSIYYRKANGVLECCVDPAWGWGPLDLGLGLWMFSASELRAIADLLDE